MCGMITFMDHGWICIRYLYFFEKGNPQITSAAIQGLIELITNEMQSDSGAPNTVSDAFFASTLRYIQFQKQKGGIMSEKYDSVKVWIACMCLSYATDMSGQAASCVKKWWGLEEGDDEGSGKQ